MIIVIVTSVSISSYLYLIVKKNHFDDTEKQARLLTETTAIIFINTLLYEELDLVEEGGLIENQIVDMLDNENSEIIDMVVLSPAGNIIAASNYKWYDKDFLSSRTSDLKLSKKMIVFPTVFNEIRALEIVMPLQIYGKTFGTLVTYHSLEKEYKYLAMLRNQFILLISLGVVCALGLAFFIARILANPVKRLAHEMVKVSDPYYRSKLVSKRHDEIGLLERGFLNMMDRLKRAAIEKEKAQKMLIQTEKMATLGTLTAGLAHEINNPLGGIKNCLRRIELKPTKTEQNRKYFKLIKHAFERIENLVNDLMLISRKKDDTLKPINFNEVIFHALELLEYQLQKKNISIKKYLIQNLPLIWGNTEHLEQVLINLILNSINAMSENGILEIKTNFTTQKVKVMIIDNGIGIPEREIYKIFDPFYSTKDVGKGTGLGLTMCKTIVDSHSGTIVVDSKVDEGTMVMLEFPAITDSTEINSGLSAAILAGGKSGRMGTNKALLRLNGTTLIEQIVNIVKKDIDRLWIITNSKEDFQFLDLPLVSDEIKDIGPLGGIYTALQYCKTTHCLIIACDLPFITEEVIGQLLDNGLSYDVLAIDTGNGVEPLCTIYSKNCLAQIGKQIQEKNYRITDVFPEVETKIIEMRHDSLEDFTDRFFNVNTPKDYKKAQKLSRILGT